MIYHRSLPHIENAMTLPRKHPHPHDLPRILDHSLTLTIDDSSTRSLPHHHHRWFTLKITTSPSSWMIHPRSLLTVFVTLKWLGFHRRNPSILDLCPFFQILHRIPHGPAIQRRQWYMLNRMPFSAHRSDWPSSLYGRLSRQCTGVSQKRLSIPPVTVVSLLVSISFYVSSRRIRICIHIERIPTISIHRATREDNFTLQAMIHWIFDSNRLTLPISSFNSIDWTFRLGNRVRWIQCRSQIESQVKRCQAMEDFNLQSTGVSDKRLWIPPRTIFSLLIPISFYVSSRRVRICVHVERIPNISIRRATREGTFTVQAMMYWKMIWLHWLSEYVDGMDWTWFYVG